MLYFFPETKPHEWDRSKAVEVDLRSVDECQGPLGQPPNATRDLPFNCIQLRNNFWTQQPQTNDTTFFDDTFL